MTFFNFKPQLRFLKEHHNAKEKNQKMEEHTRIWYKSKDASANVQETVKTKHNIRGINTLWVTCTYSFSISWISRGKCQHNIVWDHLSPRKVHFPVFLQYANRWGSPATKCTNGLSYDVRAYLKFQVSPVLHKYPCFLRLIRKSRYIFTSERRRNIKRKTVTKSYMA